MDLDEGLVFVGLLASRLLGPHLHGVTTGLHLGLGEQPSQLFLAVEQGKPVGEGVGGKSRKLIHHGAQFGEDLVLVHRANDTPEVDRMVLG